MRKNLKLMAVLSAAAVMTVAAPEMGLTNNAGTAYARTTGWVEEDGSFRFYEEEEYYSTDTWKKRGDDWYYLDEDGLVATDQQIDEYYVNAEGKRVSNQWVSVANEEAWDSPDEPEFHWFYYDKTGKASVSKWQTLDNKTYYFDENGHMVTGKVEIGDFTYYFGDLTDGVMKTGWIQLETEDEDGDYELSWYYFEKSGKMIVDQVDKKIDGAYFSFVEGKMQTGWYKLPADDSAATSSDASKDENAEKTAQGYQFYDEDGKRANGWRTIEGIEKLSEEGEHYNFFFKNGAPFYAEKGIELFTVDSRKYGFNTKGEMQTGLKVANTDDGEIANFYFGTDGVMKTGKQTIYDEDLGENQTWYFHTDGSRKGQGFHGIRDNTLYKYGLKQEADADLKVAPVTHEDSQYLINTSGNIQKASSSSKSTVKPELGNGFKDFKDNNGKTWVVNVNGIIQ